MLHSTRSNVTVVDPTNRRWVQRILRVEAQATALPLACSRNEKAAQLRAGFILGAFLLSILFIPALALAQVPEIVDASLNKHWEKNTANRNVNFEIEPVTNEREAIAAFAWVVNRVHHSDFNTALDVCSKLVDAYAGNLDAWYAKAWLELRRGKIDAGLIALQRYREHMDAAAMDEATRIIHLRRMGRLSGFVEGPANESANSDLFQQTLDRLTENLQPAESEAFSEQFDAAIDHFISLNDQLDDRRQQSLADAQQRQQEELLRLQQESSALKTSTASVQEAAVQVRERVERDLDSLSRRIPPLEDEALRLRSILDALNFDITVISRDMIVLQAMADEEPDPARRRFLLNQIANLSLQLGRIQSQSLGVRSQLNRVINQRDSILMQMGQIENRGGQQLNQLGRELENLDKQRARNERIAARTKAPPKVSPGDVASLRNRIRFLGTYDSFPTESLRQEIIDYYK
ncbi:MAG TPA: hypothetical protein PKD64_01870 [Pirellulaceae bacterium]|nr:hypothetical protein [Pirellulaceae bacterium]HMO90918.1 hypothetical protein [Pirellulaceae bacterium]HMP68606.1 hypothetical protein [Pirellulaceae bacterium]